MYYYDPYDEGEVADNNGLIDLKPGMQHMDGNTALQYVRFRHDEMGDIGRIERQQKFAKALLAQIASPVIVTKIPSIIGEVNAAVKTDLPVSQMLSLGKIIKDAYKQGLKTDTVSGKPVYIDNISYWLPDILAMRKQVAQIQGIVLDNKYLTEVRSLASEYANANSVTSEMQATGTSPVMKTTSVLQKTSNSDKQSAETLKNTVPTKPKDETVRANGQGVSTSKVVVNTGSNNSSTLKTGDGKMIVTDLNSK